MQTTLLGLAIALILALVSALVAPLVVDWNNYRGAFEAEASRITGLHVQIDGAIEARLLPSPVVTLHDVEVGTAGAKPQLRAKAVKLDLGLSPLLRGVVQASAVELTAPQVTLGLDRSGRIDWPTPAVRPPGLSIARLNVDGGRFILSDAVSGSRLVADKFWFKGYLGSFSGPFNGDGGVVVRDQLYHYRISAAPAASGSGVKIGFSVEPTEQPLTTQFDGTLNFDHGVPHFIGTMALARPVGAMLANGRRVVSAPWRVTAALDATPLAASVHHAALRYGPEERALNFSGNAALTLGPHPQLHADISALQLDVDRALADPDMTNRPPPALFESLLQSFAKSAGPPVPGEIAFNVAGMTVGGTVLESLHADLEFDPKGWSLKYLHFRAPGITDVSLSGRLGRTARGFEFTGPAQVQSADTDRFAGWISGRGSDHHFAAATPARAQGVVTFASDRVAVDQLTATLGQDTIGGHFAYSGGGAGHPARLDIALRAAKLDLDALSAFANGTGGGPSTWPRDVKLALDIGQAKFAGVNARAIKAQIEFDAGKQLQINQLSIGDLGGAALAINGSVDDLPHKPRGKLTLDLDARSLEGVADILAKFQPQRAGELRRAADRLAPASLQAQLTLAPAANAGNTAELQVNGTAAAMRIAVHGTASGEAFSKASVAIDGQVNADDGAALVALLGLDSVVAVDRLPGRLTLSAAGPLDGGIGLDIKLAASGLDSEIKGPLRFDGDATPKATLQVRLSAGDLRPLQKAMTGQPGQAVPVSLRAALAVDGAELSLTDIVAHVGQSAVKGHLAVKLANPIGINGDIEADRAAAPSVTSLLLGLPQSSTAQWSSELIGNGAFGALDGAVRFKLDRADLTPALVMNGVTGRVRFQNSQIALDNIEGGLAGGRLTGTLGFHRDAAGLAVHGSIGLVDAAAAPLLGPALNMSDGTLTADVQYDGLGASPSGLIGSLHGNGTVTFKNAKFAGLDPAAFAAALKDTGPSGSIDMTKVRSAVGAVLANGNVSVPAAAVALTIAAGVINVNQAKLQAQNQSELSLDCGVDLTNAAINGRVTLSEPPPANALLHTRPELSIGITGPLGAPQRTLDLSALSTWLTLNTAELQSRRIEALEANRHVPAAGVDRHEVPPSIMLIEPGSTVELPAPALAPSASGATRLERLQRPEKLSAAPADPTSATNTDANAAAIKIDNPGPPTSGTGDPLDTTAVAPLPAPAPRAIRPNVANGSTADDQARPRPAPRAAGTPTLNSRIQSLLHSLFGAHQ